MSPKNSYLRTVNRLFLILLAAHLPAMCAVALWFGTGVRLAGLLSVLFVGGPALLYWSDSAGKLTSVSMGAASMCFSALLIHLSGGMLEMHFHIFTMLALMVAFRFPWPLIVSAAVIAVHHIAFFFWLPRSVFNYQATFGIVLLHAFFVVFEVVPALWLTKMLADSAEAAEKSQERLKAMVDSMRRSIDEITGTVDVLMSTSTSISASSANMTRDSQTASNKTHVMADLAGRMNSAAVSMAAQLSGASTRLSTVASETEQMNASIGEIAGNSQKARRITDEATQRATTVKAGMSQLSHAVQEIGKITETITEISSQTNLLALNATIEAARAGAAGKGFSVVASEIKALAQQTSAATEDIKLRIEGLRKTAAGGVDEIEKITRVVDEVTGVVSSIAAAIEEQSVVCHSIARNITDASGSLQDANQGASHTSRTSGEIADDVAGVNRISTDITRGGELVLAGAHEISEVAAKLRAGFSRFQAFCESHDSLLL